jgi:protein involved in polysaccharide export with SLBB domain
MRLALPLYTLFTAVSVSSGAVEAQVATTAPEVRLGPGDAIRLEVFPERGALPVRGLESGRERLDYDVDSSGRVLLPVAGVVQVEGRDFEDVRADVVRAFSEEFSGALVRLIPLLRIGVLGEVRTPGLLPVDPTMSVSDVLAAAGGLTDLANQEDIRLVRDGRTVLVSSAEDVVEVRDRLSSGDQIVVGRRSWISQNTPWLIGAGASVVASVLTALLVR